MRVLRGRSFSQNLKVQRSVGRAKDGTTFPLSLKLKHKPSGEEAEAGQAAPEQGYLASVWVFFTISGLITLLPDGTIYGVNHSFALMLFGYGKTELLGKVGPPCMAGPVPQGRLVRIPLRGFAMVPGPGLQQLPVRLLASLRGTLAESDSLLAAPLPCSFF